MTWHQSIQKVQVLKFPVTVDRSFAFVHILILLTLSDGGALLFSHFKWTEMSTLDLISIKFLCQSS